MSQLVIRVAGALLLPCALSAQLTTQQESLRDYYNTTYLRNVDGVFNPAPNSFLVEILGEVEPGRALDVGMGQGRNAIYLAQRGWKVTGVDISDEGIRQPKESARKLNLDIEALNTPIESFKFGTRTLGSDPILLSGPTALCRSSALRASPRRSACGRGFPPANVQVPPHVRMVSRQ